MHITHRFFGAILIAMSGASVMIAMTVPRDVEWAFVLAATCGAFIAGSIGAPLFGRPAGQGVVIALLGAVFTTALGAAIAGLGLGIVIGEPAGALVAPLVVATAILDAPHVLFVWFTTMAGAHLVMWAVQHRTDWAG
jgi:hypothetical protein